MYVDKHPVFEDVLIITPTIHNDDRGHFFEAFNLRDFYDRRVIELPKTFVQDNQVRSRYGVLRGLHFQKKNPQDKLIQVLSGKIFDVFVDIDKASPNFGKWSWIEMSDKGSMIYIPGHYAHGYLTLEDETLVHYKCTDFYYPAYEECLWYLDPDVGIKWPELKHRDYPALFEQPTVSDKDQKGKKLKEL